MVTWQEILNRTCAPSLCESEKIKSCNKNDKRSGRQEVDEQNHSPRGLWQIVLTLIWVECGIFTTPSPCSVFLNNSEKNL